MIYVTVGGGPFWGFDRLIKVMDDIAEVDGHPVVIQRGCSRYIPQRVEFHDFVDFATSVGCFRSADLIVGHAGAGTVLLARTSGKKLVIVPRDPDLGEICDEHQQQLAARLTGRNDPMLRVVYDIAKLHQVLKDILATPVQEHSIQVSGPDRIASVIQAGLKEWKLVN